MKYGDVYWAAPDPGIGREQAGRRPVLIVSSDDAIAAIPQVVTTIPLTTRHRHWPTHIEVTGPATGLTQSTWAICEQVRTISTERIHEHLGTADADTVNKTARILRYLLNLP